jgi:hypothetical protein
MPDTVDDGGRIHIEDGACGSSLAWLDHDGRLGTGRRASRLARLRAQHLYPGFERAHVDSESERATVRCAGKAPCR